VPTSPPRLLWILLAGLLFRPAGASAAVEIAINVVDISTIEGSVFTGQVASFTDSDITQGPADFTATIDWGDGTTSAGTISVPNVFPAVFGTHTYDEEGNFPLKVTVTDTANAVTASNNGTARVQDADNLSGTGLDIQALRGVGFDGPVAKFTDLFPETPASDFDATIYWGDSLTPSVGTVTGTNGAFTVAGQHVYAAAGVFTTQIELRDRSPGTANTVTRGRATVIDAAAASAIPGLSGRGLLFLALGLAVSGSLLLRAR